MRRAPIWLLLAASCTVGEDAHRRSHRAFPLIGGVVDADDPAVVALAFGSDPNSAFCTGTLVSPSVVLTAAHCVDFFSGDPSATVFFGTDVKGEGRRIGIKDKQQHLGWTGNVGSFDIAMVVTNFPSDPLLPVPLNGAALDDLVGEPYRHVGFGVNDRVTGLSDGKKRTGTTTITELVAPDVIHSGDEELSVCFGDSGGPGLIAVDGVEYVAGVHSYTNGENCNPPNGDTRVDAYLADFVLPFIQEFDPTCGADGLCAPIGCIDDTDCEPCGRDGACTDGCALPDPDCPTSELGEICQADSQCMSELCVFWRDDLEYRFCSVACEPGSGGCPDGMSCQDVPPFGSICYYDDAPPGVLGDSCEESVECGSYVCDDGQCVYACDVSKDELCPAGFECREDDGDAFYCRPIATEGGCGCRAAGPGSALGGLLLLALAGLGLRVRRRAIRPSLR